ncbi:unnamed protein product [Ambrosiozyma monospora]|uniref:Unnamed protein product n=1 Tax=Ambrosiozyma monospora TaxID=43982 RepID=A0A9W6YW43_AMBMO|nr:unnamed protein product [Ambrosiozyma monospora]
MDSDSDDELRINATKQQKKGKKTAPKKKSGPSGLKGQSGGYLWEDEYKRSWDIVQEDADGSIAAIVSGLVDLQKKRYLKNVKPFQRGIIRTMVLVLDMSKVMSEKDLRPNRASMMISYAIDFVNEFYDQNPISQLKVGATR